MTMKIAIPSDDKVNLCAHFGKTRGFMIYEIENNRIANREYRDNTFTGHAMGMHHEHNHNDEHHQQHTHSRILNALFDCETVIAGGMGRRLLDDLQQAQKEVIVTRKMVLEDVVNEYLEGSLSHDDSGCCDH